MMSRERWQRIQSMFDELADVPAAERAERLGRACADDTDLRRSVESLLASDERTADPVLNAIGAAAESLLIEHQDRLLGTRVGPYRIISVLGQGGMSTVYRAERDDARYNQTVAIKVLHHSALHPRLRSRLHSERHILATLAHPSIARLIDSGELEDGTPYLVMEHVDGEGIDSYCDRRTLFVRQRLELFLQVCEAVHYAHRNLVVHRDIKAANILVNSDGVPKLLDFGIAKLLAPQSLAHTVPVTRLQERILTPENAAPEQVLGQPITTATDVYALGVLLHQLLTGRSPYRLTSYSQLQLERAICMDDPLRPSQIVTAQFGTESDADRSRLAERRGLSPLRLKARLSGDLDSIVAMAMRKEPDRRYPSVEAFAEDIRRHLDGKPVRARQGDWRYNAAKFMRRHLIVVTAIGAVVVGLAGFAAIMVHQNHRIEAESERAAQELENANQVSGFLVDVFSSADPFTAQGREITAKELLDRGADNIRSNVNLPQEVRARLLESIGLAYRRQGIAERAVPLFEEAVAIRRAERPFDAHRTAAALANLARALSEAGQLASAETDLQNALAMSRAGDTRPSEETADIMVEYAQFALAARSNPQLAEKYFSEARAVYTATIGEAQPKVGQTLSGLAKAAAWTHDFDKAEDYQRQAIRIYQSSLSRTHPDYTTALDTLGYILIERGKLSEAEQMLTETLQIHRKVFGEDSARVAQVESHLAMLYQRAGDPGRGLQAALRAEQIAAHALGAAHYLTGYYEQAVAELEMRGGDLVAAESAARHSLAVLEGALKSRHLYLAYGHELLGEILARRGSLEAAELESRAALEMTAQLAGKDSWRTARSEASLGWILIERDLAADGEPMLRNARDRLVRSLGPGHPATQEASLRLAQFYRAHHRDADAAKVLPDSDKR